jgi:predicted CDP-diglyceride synthetase/phosphatidate cytidylyltransferase
MTKIGWWYNSLPYCCLSVIPQRRCCVFFCSFSSFLSFFCFLSLCVIRPKRQYSEFYPLRCNICASVCLDTHSNNIYLSPIIALFSLLRLSELCVYGKKEHLLFFSYQQHGISTRLFHVRNRKNKVIDKEGNTK